MADDSQIVISEIDDFSFRGYRRLIWKMVKKHRGEFLGGLSLSVLVAVWTAWLQWERGVVEKTKLWDNVVSASIPAVVTLLVFLLVELITAAFRIYRIQATTISIKQTTIDLNTSERSEGEQRIRDSHKRREAALIRSRDREMEALRAQIAAGTTPEPDILLDYGSDGFTLENPQSSGHARDIRIAPLTTGDYISGYAMFGGNKVPINTSAVTVDFPPVGHLDNGDAVVAAPVVRDTSPLRAPSTFDDFIQAALKRRQFEDEQQMQAAPEKLPLPNLQPLEVEDRQLAAHFAFKNYLKRTLDIQIVITYRNSSQTRRWERRETLRYEPDQKRAYIMHGERREITAATITAAAPRSLSAIQRDLIVQRLKHLTEAHRQKHGFMVTIGVGYSPTSLDASAYAYQFADALRDAGFAVRGVAKLDHREAKDLHGIWVRKESTWGPPEYLPIPEELQKALADGGIATQLAWVRDSMTSLELIIGDNPVS